MSATRRPKDLPPIPPRKKKGEPLGRGRWNDVLIVHDDIRFGVTNFRSIQPGDPHADNETPETPQTTTTAPRRKR
ncbi:hypothetical protein AAFP35_25805 [Gordonia sp. CPCC 206044]|uniref:hypothetical protein n=1 Tax=Gordonia sp. CPCC 206044 TaxID=3140793 RepID=UPI003AF3BED7